MKNIKIILLSWTLILLSCSEKTEINQNIEIFCQSGITEFNLNSLEEIQKFKNYLSVTPNCNNFSGSIYIHDVSLNNQELQSLQFLKQLKVIDGSLVITNVQNLESLEGLSNLEKIGGSLIIQRNNYLISLAALKNLKEIGESLVIHSNNNLEKVNGLSNIQEITELSIGGNSSLKNLDGLSNLKMIRGFYETGHHRGLVIAGNKNLENINGLSKLTELGSLRIINNDLLKNLDGLENVNGLFSIDLNDNKSLTNIDAFSNVKDLGYLSIKNNESLRNFDGLVNLETINEVFYLEKITADFEANLFPNFKSIGSLQLMEISNTKNTFNSFNGLDDLKQLSIKNVNSNVIGGFNKIEVINQVYISGNDFKEINDQIVGLMQIEFTFKPNCLAAAAACLALLSFPSNVNHSFVAGASTISEVSFSLFGFVPQATISKQTKQ